METFKPGQAVWAKMKGYPLWPGKIMYIENILKPKNKMKYQVFFFGTYNYAWIKYENLMPHTEKIISTLIKRRSTMYQAAIDEVVEYYIIQKENESNGTADQDSDENKHEIDPNFKICNEDKNEGKDELTPSFEIIEISSDSGKDTKYEPSSTHKTYSKNDAKEMKKDTTCEPSSTPKTYSRNDAKEMKKDTACEPSSTHKTNSKNDAKEMKKDTACELSSTHKTYSKNDAKEIKTKKSKRCNTGLKSHTVPVKNRKLVQFPFHAIIQPCVTQEPMNDMKHFNNLKLGFIGLGNLRRSFIEKLVHDGHSVSICCEYLDSTYDDFEKIGATIAKDPGYLIIKCDIVFCYVKNSDAVKKVLFSNHGVISGLQKLRKRSNEFAHYRGYIEMSAIDTELSITHCEAVTRNGGHYLEVYNILKGNEKENTVYLIAGDYSLYDTTKSFLKEWALKVFYISKRSGNACIMKTLFNALSGTICAAVAESSVLIDRLKLPKDEFVNFIKNGPINCQPIVELAQKMAQENFKKDISLKVIEQDLFNAVKLGHKIMESTPIIGAANELYRRAKYMDINADMSAVYKILKYN